MLEKVKEFFVDRIKEQSLLRNAWKAEKEGRHKTVEEMLIQLTLLRLRGEFTSKARNTKRLLTQKTRSGLYERDYVDFSEPVLGVELEPWYLRQYHSVVVGPDSKISSTGEAKKIKDLATSFGLSAKFLTTKPLYDSSIRVQRKSWRNEAANIILRVSRNPE